MPSYSNLKKLGGSTRRRAVERLLELKDRLNAEIPEKTIRETLLLSTWNIREFGSSKHGGRLEESYHYIAEIISRFDLVAVQEILRDLGPLKRVMDILGEYWDFIVTDVTEGRSGNSERTGFVYDRRKVSFGGVAGEITLPKNDRIKGDLQFARTPFIVSFKARWFKFNLCCAHIYYGKDYGEKLERRIDEIDAVAEFLKKRAKKEPENFILLGDFNIAAPNHRTMRALLRHGFIVPEAIQKLPSNVSKTYHYDQIAFKPNSDKVKLGSSSPNAGTFDFFKTVFRQDDHKIYKSYFPKNKSEDYRYYERWRTYQISDHLPLWVELQVDFSKNYLKNII